MGIGFYTEALLFGVALAMDAFAVSVVSGLNEPRMRLSRMNRIAGCFALFQIFMPLAGWLLVTKAEETFEDLSAYIPWIALVLLVYLGSMMIYEALRPGDAEEKPVMSTGDLIVQGVATSIDALSVGFTIAGLGAMQALTEALIIGAVTYVICMCGIRAGKYFGEMLAKKAPLLGGVILIAIGLKVFFG
ncbi:MAG: manganese efflux pump [Firmicutes bacterium]|nr:manganese efflux pump [Bacillota bacterium]